MDYLMNSAGLGVPCIREFETSSAADIVKGTVMTLSDGKAVKASDGSTVLGILAEDYKTAKDELNPRSGSGRVKIIISPGMICRQKLQQMTVGEKGTATSVKAAGIIVPTGSNAFVGGYVKLVGKADNSENTDSIGKTRKITASSGVTLTIEEGGIPCVGDVYAILPPVGYANMALSSDGTKYAFSTTKSTIAQVVSCLPENDYTEIAFVKTFFH